MNEIFDLTDFIFNQLTLILLIVSIGTSFIAYILNKKQLNFINKSIKATGTVIAIRKYTYRSHSHSSGSTSSLFYSPIIKYEIGFDKYFIFNTMGRNIIKHKIGQRVPVLVLKDNPSIAISNDNSHKIWMLILSLLTLITLGIFIFSYEFNLSNIAASIFILVALFATIIIKIKKSGFNLEKITEANTDGFKTDQTSRTNPADNPKKDEEYLTDVAGYRKEKAGIDKATKIMSIVFIFIGIGVLYLAWDLYQSTDQGKKILGMCLGAFGSLAILGPLKELRKLSKMRR